MNEIQAALVAAMASENVTADGLYDWEMERLAQILEPAVRHLISDELRESSVRIHDDSPYWATRLLDRAHDIEVGK